MAVRSLSRGGAALLVTAAVVLGVSSSAFAETKTEAFTS